VNNRSISRHSKIDLKKICLRAPSGVAVVVLTKTSHATVANFVKKIFVIYTMLDNQDANLIRMFGRANKQLLRLVSKFRGTL
jgi:hypothetical protein